MDQGFRAGGLAVPSDFSSVAMQRFGIWVAEVELDVLTLCLDRLAADAEFFRNLTGAVARRHECEHRDLAVAADIEAAWKFATPGDLVHGNRSRCSTGVRLACH